MLSSKRNVNTVIVSVKTYPSTWFYDMTQLNK